MLEMRDGPGAGAADRARARNGGASERGGGAVVVTADTRQQLHLLQRMLDTANLSVVQAAQQLGVRPQSLRQYLTGRRRINLSWLVRIATLCRCSIVVDFANGPS
jgi:hypothetical protein